MQDVGLNNKSSRLPSAIRSLAPLIVHWVGFLLMNQLVFRLGRLQPADYESKVLVTGLASKLITNPWLWAFVIGPVCTQLATRFRILATWHIIENGRFLRLFATGLGLILAITLAGQSVNLFFGQEYLLDRMLLLVLAASIWFHPILIVPFVVLVVAVGGQIAIPIAGYGWDRHLLGIYRLPIHLLLVVCTRALVRHTEKPSGSQSTILLVLIVLASYYWVPGFGKLRSGWVMVPNVHLSLFGAWSHGWLSALPAETIAKLTQSLSTVAIPLQITVLLIECGAVFVSIRRVSRVLLPMWALFHVGAWVMYGFSFWAWILIDLAVFIFVWKKPDIRFGWPECVVGFLLVGSSGFWLSPNRLAWFNAPMANSYRVFGTTDDGNTFEIGPAELAPYDYIFTMQMFSTISTQKQLVGPYGATSISERVFTSGADLAEAQAKLGKRKPDQQLKDQLASVITRYVDAWNRGRDNQPPLSFLSTPALLNTTLPKTRPLDKRIVSIRLMRVRSYLTPETVVRETVEECLKLEFSVPAMPR